MQNLTVRDRLYCDVGRLREKGEFGFAPRTGKFQSLSMLRYCIEIADKYQLYCCKQKHTPLKLFLAAKSNERFILIQQFLKIPAEYTHPKFCHT